MSIQPLNSNKSHIGIKAHSDSLAIGHPDFFGLRPWINWLIARITALGQYMQRSWRGEQTPLINRIRPTPLTVDFATFSQFVHTNIWSFNCKLDEQIRLLPQVGEEGFSPAYQNIETHAHALQRHVEQAGLWMREHQEEYAELSAHEITSINQELSKSAELIGNAIRLAPNQGLILQAAPLSHKPLTQIGIPLYNPNVKCFLNSMVQLFLSVRSLRENIILREKQNPTIRRHAFYYLDHLYKKEMCGIAPPRRGYDLSEIVRVLGQGINAHPDSQHDAQEAAAALFEPFDPTEEIARGNPLFAPVQLKLRLDLTPLIDGPGGIEAITAEETRRLNKDGTYSSSIDPYSIYSLPFKRETHELPSIEEMLYFFCNSSHEDSTYVKNIEINHPETGQVRKIPTRITEELKRFEAPPEVMLLQFKRFNFDRVTEQQTKNHQIIDFPERFIIGGPDFFDDPETYAEYRNIGFVHHEGGSFGGHYICAVQDTDTDQWYKINDLPGYDPSGFPKQSEIAEISADEARKLREESYMPIIVKVRDVLPKEGLAAMELRKHQVKERELKIAIKESQATAAANSPEAKMEKLKRNLEIVRMFADILESASSSPTVVMEFFADLPQDFKNFCIAALKLEKGYVKEFDMLLNLKELATIVKKYVATEVSQNIVKQYLFIRERNIELMEMDIARIKKRLDLVQSSKPDLAEYQYLEHRIANLNFNLSRFLDSETLLKEEGITFQKIDLALHLLIPDLQPRLEQALGSLLESGSAPTLENYQAAVKMLIEDCKDSIKNSEAELKKVAIVKEE